MGIENYRGLEVLEQTSGVAAGGEAISDNFRKLADWRPQCNWELSADPPDGDNDESEGYHVGSLWLQAVTAGQTTTYTLHVCVKNLPHGSADWKSVTLS